MEFVHHCLTPWIVKLEEACDAKLLRTDEQATVRTRLNIDASLRGPTVERYQAHNLAWQGGWKARNEVRTLEGLPPIDGGDVALVPLNMGPANGQPTNSPNIPAA